MSDKLLVRVEEAARMMDCGRSTFWERVKKGIYPKPIKHGGSTRWLLADLQRLLQSNQTTTP